MEFKIYKPHDTHFLKILLYGDPGTGKTTLAASAQNVESMKPVLFCNVEGGMLSISDPEAFSGDPPDVVDIHTYADMEELFAELATGGLNYRTLVIDSLSELVQMNVESIAKKKGRMNDVIFLEDHGANSKQIRRMVRQFRDLPMHVIMTSHAMALSDRADADVVPALPPKIRRSVCGYVDIIGYAYTSVEEIKSNGDTQEQVVFKLLTRDYGKWMAKDRTPGMKLGGTLENATMADIMNKIGGTHAKNTRSTAKSK